MAKDDYFVINFKAKTHRLACGSSQIIWHMLTLHVIL